MVEGKMEAEGSWADSLAIEYTEPTFTTKRPDDFVGLLGSTFYVRITWSVGDADTYPMAAKLNWFKISIFEFKDSLKQIFILIILGTYQTVLLVTSILELKNPSRSSTINVSPGFSIPQKFQQKCKATKYSSKLKF